MKLERQLKLALDENRLLIFGSQVLFGFQFNGIFQQQFGQLPTAYRALIGAGLPLLMAALALLITPSMHHRLVEAGEDSPRVLRLVTGCAGIALLPVAVALSFDIFVALTRIMEGGPSLWIATAFFALALLCWYAVAWLCRRKEPPMPSKPHEPTPLTTKVEQLLTEARVIIPGAKALLGFQLTVTLTQAFGQLPPTAKTAHAIALCCIGLSVILLMAPASVHRIAFSGEDDPQFLKIGSVFVIAAPLPLALGMALDSYVAASRAFQSEWAPLVLAGGAAVGLLGCWYGYPVWRRRYR